MTNPDIVLKFDPNDQRQLFGVEFGKNQQLLVETSFYEQSVEVYQIERKPEPFTMQEPTQTIETEAKGLSAVVVGSDKIFMGFSSSMMSPNAQVQVYSHDYEQL